MFLALFFVFIQMFSFEMLLYAFVILFNFLIFLNVCIYSIYRVLVTFSCL